jgi:hypothetical protein
LALRLETPNGQPAPLHGEAAGGLIGGELHLGGSAAEVATDQTLSFAFNFHTVPLAALGAYVLVCSIDGTEVRWLSFTVGEVPQ